MSSVLHPDREREKENLILSFCNLKVFLSVYWDKSSPRHRASCLTSQLGVPRRESGWHCSVPTAVFWASRHSRLAQWGASGMGQSHSVPGLFPSVSRRVLSVHLLSESRPLDVLSGGNREEPGTGPHCWELQGRKILGTALRSAGERALHPSVENNVRTASYPLSHNVCSGPQRVSRLRAQMTT